MSRSLEDVQVGDELYLRSSNELHEARRRMSPVQLAEWLPPTVTVEKVGPKRVAFVSAYGRLAYANRETGRIDDWTWLQRKEAFHEERARSEMWRHLKGYGLEPGLGHRNKIPTEVLAKILMILEETS